ncbi:MAG: hydroxyacid dehydrogenase [Chitinivibrionales bacterium]|nr:hydroxyacid dehydrogenase [Chitinivibrionales bacterium]MBD3394735.1 hydroxyacid dehydrogenase [Chitinivibrionales bacterium]
MRARERGPAVKTVLLNQPVSGKALCIFEGKATVVTAPDPSRDTVAGLLKEADGMVLRTMTYIDAAMIASAPGLKVISRTGIGVDNVDVAAATRHGVMVCNVRGVNVTSVAEHTVSLVLAVAKALPFLDSNVRQGNWSCRNEHRPVELKGKQLGLVGMGRIGSRVAEILGRAFGMRVLAYDPYVTEDQFPAVEFCGLDALMSRADVVSVHLPSSAETRQLLNADLLARMKPSAFIVNTARGQVIDQEALAEALAEHRIAGAGLDVFEEEPFPADSRLASLSNVILTPHAAALTEECVTETAVRACRSVLDVLEGREPESVVNRDALREGTHGAR